MNEDPGPPLDDAQRARVARHRDRVAMVARVLVKRLPHMDLEELEGLGIEGLIEAARRYDPASGVPFGAFAHYRIKGRMLDGARRRQRAGRQHARALRKLETTQALLERAAVDTGSRRDAAPTGDVAALRERVARARAIVERTAAAALMSQTAAVEPDSLAKPDDDDIEQRMLGDELRRRLRDCVATLPDEDRKLVEALYERDASMQAVADQLGINKSTVSRRHARILGELAQRLRAPDGPGP